MDSSRAPTSVMFASTILLASVAVTLSVAANPVVVRDSFVTLPLVKRFNFTGAASLLQHDQARAQKLKALGNSRSAERLGFAARSEDAVISVPAVNDAVNYALNVSISSILEFGGSC